MAVRNWALAGLLAVGLQACGSGEGDGAASNGAEAAGSAPAAAAAADPCALVTKEEVQAATRETIVAAKAGGEACTYESDDAMASSVTITVRWTNGPLEMAMAREAAVALDRMGSGMAETKGAEGDAGAAMTSGGAVAGIGGEAFFGSNEELHVLKKGVYFAVTPPTMRSRMSGGNPMLSAEQKREMARAIAQKAAARI
jgi:hypothetical protein